MFEDICSYIELVKTSSFTQASQHLNVSVSVITRRIKKLEHSLKCILIDRNTRKFTLTEAGRIFYENSLNIFNEYETSKKRIRDLKQTLSGVIKVGLPYSLESIYAIPKIKEYLEKNKEIKLIMVHGNHIVDMLENQYDLIIHCGAIPDCDFYYKTLSEWQQLVCASKLYIDKHSQINKPTDLEKHNCLDHYENYGNVWNLYENGKKIPIKIKGNFSTNSSIELKKLAVEGVGIVFLPSFIVNKEIESNQLDVLLKEYLPAKLNISAIYPKTSINSCKVKTFIDFFYSCISP